MDVDERPCKRDVFQADFEGFSYKKAFFFPGPIDGIWDSPCFGVAKTKLDS